MRYEDGGPLKTKSMDFSVRIYNLAVFLTNKQEFVKCKQILKSGTSIGANIAESRRAESLSDFRHKLGVAQKECEETRYWLELLNKVGIISDAQFQSVDSDAAELDRMLTASINTTKNKE